MRIVRALNVLRANSGCTESRQEYEAAEKLCSHNSTSHNMISVLVCFQGNLVRCKERYKTYLKLPLK